MVIIIITIPGDIAAVHYYKDRRGSVFQQANDRYPAIYLHLAVDSGLTYLQNKVHVELLLSTLK